MKISFKVLVPAIFPLVFPAAPAIAAGFWGTDFSAPRISFTTSEECAAISNPMGNRHSGLFYPDDISINDPHDHSLEWPKARPREAQRQCLDEAKLEQAAAHFGQLPPKMEAPDASLRYKTALPASFLVIRNGKIVLEKYFHGATAQTSNSVHSASKTILSLAYGIALGEKKLRRLDQTLYELLPEYAAAFDTPAKKSLTIRHLLSMEGGLRWTEDKSESGKDGIETKPDWLEAILSLPSDSPPGKKFHYNTGLTHLLSAALSKITGKSTCDYVSERIFKPMNIKAERWLRDPQGIFAGGYGVNLTPRELAKFGQLMQDEGRWKGVPLTRKNEWLKNWIKQMHSSQAGGVGSVSYPSYTLKYGFLGWIRENNPPPPGKLKPKATRYSCAWGWGGQFVCNIWKLGIVVVMTTNTSEKFVNDANGFEIMDKYVIPAITDYTTCDRD